MLYWFSEIWHSSLFTVSLIHVILVFFHRKVRKLDKRNYQKNLHYIMRTADILCTYDGGYYVCFWYEIFDHFTCCLKQLLNENPLNYTGLKCELVVFPLSVKGISKVRLQHTTYRLVQNYPYKVFKTVFNLLFYFFDLLNPLKLPRIFPTNTGYTVYSLLHDNTTHIDFKYLSQRHCPGNRSEKSHFVVWD